MKENQKVLLVLVFCLVVVSGMFFVEAGRETYNDDTPDATFGTWTASDDCYEEYANGAYQCEMLFVFTEIRTDGSAYYINIDYDGCDPGYPWNCESIYAHYKWGSGEWILIAWFDYVVSDKDWSINDPGDEDTLYLRFKNAAPSSDSTKHTWYSSDTPYVAVDY